MNEDWDAFVERAKSAPPPPEAWGFNSFKRWVESLLAVEGKPPKCQFFRGPCDGAPATWPLRNEVRVPLLGEGVAVYRRGENWKGRRGYVFLRMEPLEPK